MFENLDLYPFDICFESALGLLDELVIGIDKQSFNNKYQKLLNKFLNQTKFRKKIKLIFLNFNLIQRIHVQRGVDGLLTFLIFYLINVKMKI